MTLDEAIARSTLQQAVELGIVFYDAAHYWFYVPNASGGYALAQAVLRAWQRDGTIAVTGDGVAWRGMREGSEQKRRGEVVTIEVIQNVFDKSGLVYVDDHDTALKPVVEQLSDGFFVGFYADPNAEWVDSEKLGNTPEEALARAKELVAD